MEKKIIFAVVITAIGILAIMWFYTPVPTMAARYVWNRYQASQFALALDRSDAELALDIGNRAFGLGSYDIQLAERAFRKAIAIDPGILWGHYQLARILFVEGKFAEAEAEIDQELTHNQTNLRSLYVRGLIRANSENLPGAVLDFKEFTTWAPTEWAGYNDLAWVLAKEKKYAEAESALKEGIVHARGGDKNPWLWDALGVAQLNLNQASAALSSLQKAQTFAESLTDADWKKAYPGNDPAFAESGVAAMRSGILKNLSAAYDALRK